MIIANEQFDSETGLAKIRSGNADMISFGKLYISNPDLAERLEKGQPLNTNWDLKTFFGTEHGKSGYSDYPFYRNEEIKEDK